MRADVVVMGARIVGLATARQTLIARPGLRVTLLAGPSGVRAFAVDIKGRLVDDLAIGGSANVLHVQNAPSPAATASLALGRWLANTAFDRLD